MQATAGCRPAACLPSTSSFVARRPQRAAWRQQQRRQATAAASATDVGDLQRFTELWVPDSRLEVSAGMGAPGAAASSGGDDHKPRTPPPDLPSLLLDSRIVYLGMPLVPAVTELIIAEMLYLQHKDRTKPMYLYINSTGTTRADGETVGFETEGTAIYDTMCFIKNEVHTVGVGVAIGQSCMLLSAGQKGKRFMLEHATAMLHQPRVPPTGQRQAIEIQIKWREPRDAIEYGIIDGIVTPEKQIIDDVKSAEQWDKEAGLVAR
eukprot:scaffold23.g4139.t1